MKLCQRCGTQLYDQVTVCPNCGQQQYYSYAPNNEKQAPTPMEILVSRCKTNDAIRRAFLIILAVSSIFFLLFVLLCEFKNIMDVDSPLISLALMCMMFSLIYVLMIAPQEGQRTKIRENDPVGIVGNIQLEIEQPSWIREVIIIVFCSASFFAGCLFGIMKRDYISVFVCVPMLIAVMGLAACTVARTIHFHRAIREFVEENKDYFLELERRSLIEGANADIADDIKRKNVSYYYQFDINSVYNAYVSAIETDFKKKCVEKPYYTLSFPLHKRIESHAYYMCHIHLEPCNGGTMVYIRYTLPKTSKENYEVTNNRLCGSVGMILTNPAQMYNPSYR